MLITRDVFASDFDAFIDKMRSILLKKNHDYTAGAGAADPLHNFRRSENFGVPGWKGALVRFSDKFSRLETFAKKEHFEVNDENFQDTLIDAANYLFLISELYKEYKNAKDSESTKDSNRPSVVTG
jgi:hypothetical protein